MSHDFLKLLNEGKDAWNKWMQDNPTESINIEGFDLKEKDLSGYDFSVVVASYTNFQKCNLDHADFAHADLMNASFSYADISHAKFDGANLTEANLNNVTAINSDFYQATLENADLTKGDFQKAQFAMSRLLKTKLDYANITDAILWDSQRTLWSIKGVICEKCYWGVKQGDPPSEYDVGEFEKLHTYKPIITISFPYGIKPIEFFSLSHLVHGVEKNFKNCKMRISSLYEAGKGAEVKMTIESSRDEDFEKIKDTLQEIPTLIRDNESIKYLEGINKGLELTIDKMVDKLMSKSSIKIEKIEAKNSIISSGDDAKIRIDNDQSEVIAELLNELSIFINNQTIIYKNSEEEKTAINTATLLKTELEESKREITPLAKQLGNKLNEVLTGAAGSGTWEVLSKSLQILFY